MKSRYAYFFCTIIFLTSILLAQTPTAQLKVREKGFLRSERLIQIDLSNQTRQLPLTSTNVNNGPYYYFLVTPVGDWQLDPDAVADNLAHIEIYQNEKKNAITWKGEIISGGNNSIILGFPKTISLNQVFLFQCPLGESTSQVEFKVQQELWPGFTTIVDITKQADAAVSGKQYKSAIGLYEQILSSTGLRIFPQYDESKIRRTQSFAGFLTETMTGFQTAATNTQIDLKTRISTVVGFQPTFRFIIDSLPRADWNIGSLDANVAPILEKSRNALTQITNIRDSLQHVLDDENTKWIIEGSTTSKNGYLYSYMIETLASAFSSLNFADTMAAELKVRIPDDLQTKLTKYNITESYSTFIRICNERYQTHLPIFPIEFLPNLKKDTVSFPLPYYSMLKAVSDYYYGNLSSAKEEILKIFRTCYEPEINSRFDMMRVYISLREQQISPEVMKMFQEAEQLERAKDLQNAEDKYRQITLIAPNFAYGFFSLGKFYNRKGDGIRANYSFQKAYQIDTMYLSAYRESYNLFVKQGNFKEIINVLTTAIAKKNDYWEINFDLGYAFGGDADPARAIQSFEHALALNPKSYKTNIQIGLAYKNVKNYQKAREYFNNAIGIDPTRQDAVDYLTKLNEVQRTGK
jgi:tetratricopeptide (TPR) repeat protein